MGKGVLYKANATTWSKSQSKKMNATTVSDGKVRHANATTWFDNYPMEQEYKQQFNVTWTQGYEVNTKLYAPLWSDHIYSGGNANFRSFIGFDKNAISNFITPSGKITKVQLVLKMTETSLNGSPTVYFYPHRSGSAPSSWDESSIHGGFQTIQTFPNKSYGWKYITLREGHVRSEYSDKTVFNGIALKPKSSTETDWVVFSGKSAFNSFLEITVLK